MPPFAALQPQETVYRAASNWGWIDTEQGKFLPDAFKLRKRDVDANSGISLIIAPNCPSLAKAVELSGWTKVRAVCSVIVEQVRELDLDVIQDKLHHGYIDGLPFTEDEADLETQKRINDFAYALADISTICSSAAKPQVPL